MKVVIQRVQKAGVAIGGHEISSISKGILVLVGFARGDNEEISRWMARKIVSLRIFEDNDGKMNLALENVKGEILAVSQFTLYGDCKKGRRPSFDSSADPKEAAILYEKFLGQLESLSSCPVKGGAFQEHMHISLVNDGPVTLIIEKES